MSDKIETKLTAARTRLILDKPFLGALVLRLPMKQADPDWCKTVATDARHFFYNESFIDSLSIEQTQFVLAHEAMHCALSHFARRQHRIKQRWDVACDFAINPLLINDGLIPAPNILYLKEYEDMTAEEIYPLIEESSEQGPMDDHLYDEGDGGDNGEGSQPPPKQKQHDHQKSPEGGEQQQENNKSPDQDDEGESQTQNGGGENDKNNDQQQSKDNNEQEKDGDENENGRNNSKGASRPPPLSQNEIERLGVQWQQRLAGAAQQAQQAGKLGSNMARLVDHLLQPQLPWRMLLARYMNYSARDDYSFSRPSNRRQSDAILPSLHSAQVEVTVVLDTSGSIGQKEMHEFLSEVDALKGQMRARVTLQACDEKLAEDGPWDYEPWDELKLPESIHGGGGTRFTPAFEWAEKQDKRPDLMLYFTDAEGEFPKQTPDFPVIWLVKGKAKVPFGTRIQLN